ncbi:rubrerythrin family protein [Clostridium bovifaecis]|uniref:Rubrerythrin family protein n=1 Tax=Clostridium bovifaecis TaxID=2184719 RepID=A0A6I6EM12_9CLOT|nr:rubrerythrin family protein [Clostridium bovifaecis]
MPLTNKEQTLIEDNLNAEYLCIRKYEQYAAMASDQNIKQVFTDLANKETQHANTLKGILNQNGVNPQNIFETYDKPQGDLSNIQNSLGITDAQLLNDALSTEKHVSSSYNNAVLESVDPNIRKQLQHIQQEEQGHAETLFNAMQSRGWYKVQ